LLAGLGGDGYWYFYRYSGIGENMCAVILAHIVLLAILNVEFEEQLRSIVLSDSTTHGVERVGI